MPQMTVEKLPKTSVKITFTIPQDELQPFLEEAAQRISEKSPIPGFRPGKASYEISVSSKEPSVSDEDVERTLKDLQRMQTKEIRSESGLAAGKEHKTVLNLTIKKDNVPLEGGRAVDHSVYLNEPYYIPGFTEQLVGMKEGEEKSININSSEAYGERRDDLVKSFPKNQENSKKQITNTK